MNTDLYGCDRSSSAASSTPSHVLGEATINDSLLVASGEMGNGRPHSQRPSFQLQLPYSTPTKHKTSIFFGYLKLEMSDFCSEAHGFPAAEIAPATTPGTLSLSIIFPLCPFRW